jgi:hypothetical protein
MPHVTFIHGIANKPPADRLHELWLRGLTHGGLDLLGEGVTTSMVYWADVLYAEPTEALVSTEGALDDGAEAADAALVDLPDTPTPAEQAFVEGLAEKLGVDADEAEPSSSDTPAEEALERIPLPWILKRRIMQAFIRDAHHYLFDAEFSPRSGDAFRVQTEIRRRTLAALAAAPEGERHVVVGHSLGSVIAYDVLKRAPDAPAADGLLTLGSPLGIDEVQDRLQPEWTRPDGYPGDAVRDRWVNVYDRLDVVCSLDPALASDFRRDGAEAVQDIGVANPGRWRHSFEKYAAQEALTDALASLLFD